MSYRPRVEIPNTFYVNAGSPSGSGSKGNPAAPYATPWELVGDLGSDAQVLQFSPGTFTYTGPYDGNNSHVANAENTFYHSFGATVIANSVETATAGLFSDVTGVGTDEARSLRISGGDFESNSTGTASVFMFQFLNGGSKIQLNIDSLTATGEDSSGIELGGNLFGVIKEAYVEGNRMIHFVGESNGAGAQTNTIGRRVYLEIDQLAGDGFGETEMFVWGNSAANFTETNCVIDIDVKRLNVTDQSVFFAGYLDGWNNAHVRAKLGNAIVDSGQQNAIFDMGSWNLGSAPITNSNFYFELDTAVEFGGWVARLERLTLDNSQITIKVGRVGSTNHVGSDSFFSLNDVVLTNNSAIIIDVEEHHDTSTFLDSIIQIKPGVTCDATSKIIIKGTFRTTDAKPVIQVGDNAAVVVLQDVVLENDGTVAAIQRSSVATPTVYVAGTYDTNAIVVDANVTITKYNEYV